MANHTPTPWHYTDHVGPYLTVYADGAKGRPIVKLTEPFYCDGGGVARANAEFLCRAANSHEQLVAACRRLMECGCAGGSDFGEMVWDAAVAQADAAIRAAGGPAAGAGE